MKLNEPKQSEIDKWPGHSRKENKTKGGIILSNDDYKSYTDYLKASEYRKEYKDFCIKYYLSQKMSEVINDEIE